MLKTLLLQRQVRLVGHVITMPASVLPWMVFYEHLSDGSHNVGGKRRRYIDFLLPPPPLLKKTGIQAPSLDSSAIDRVGWRTTCQTAVSALEASRPARRVQLRTQRHADLLLPLSITDTEYDCSFCDRMLRSRIRLISHEFTNNDIFGTMSMTSSSAPGDLLEQAVINEPL